jgi:two-component system, NarL family, invasion response regulator UvrY
VTLRAQLQPEVARILLVDDSALVRRSLRELLEANIGWKVCDEASDGHEAVAKFDEELFDVIVLDFQMPGMSGLEAARQIMQRYPRTRILMVTLHYSAQLLKEARSVGIKGVCPKADSKCVIEAVSTILANSLYFRNQAAG